MSLLTLRGLFERLRAPSQSQKGHLSRENEAQEMTPKLLALAKVCSVLGNIRDVSWYLSKRGSELEERWTFSILDKNGAHQNKAWFMASESLSKHFDWLSFGAYPSGLLFRRRPSLWMTARRLDKWASSATTVWGPGWDTWGRRRWWRWLQPASPPRQSKTTQTGPIWKLKGDFDNLEFLRNFRLEFKKNYWVLCFINLAFLAAKKPHYIDDKYTQYAL